jgi:hypothetical protein
MLTVVQSQIPKEVIEYVEQNRQLLKPDYSQYANKRMRAWIGAEGPLADKFSFQIPPFGYDTRLWKWLKKYCKHVLDFEAELALLHVGGADCSDPEEKPIQGRGGECGIMMHRDAGYADYRAVGINLCGEATFGYRCEYKYQDQGGGGKNAAPEIETVKMIAGTCVAFNCKNPHFAQVGPNRWCINAWRVSKKRRVEFEEWKKENGLNG